MNSLGFRDISLEELSQRFKFEDEASRKAWIMAMDHEKKGKLNKLKVGDVVMAKPELVKWHAEHLAWSYGRKAPENAGYSEGDKEIFPEDIRNVLCWSHAYITNRMPIGIVSHYGARDNDDGKDRKNVYIQFMFRIGHLRIPYGTYCFEDKLWKKKVDKKTGKVVR